MCTENDRKQDNNAIVEEPLCGLLTCGYVLAPEGLKLGRIRWHPHNKSYYYYYYHYYILLRTRAWNISGCNFGSGELHFLFRSSLVKPHRWLKRIKYRFISWKNCIMLLFFFFSGVYDAAAVFHDSSENSKELASLLSESFRRGMRPPAQRFIHSKFAHLIWK